MAERNPFGEERVASSNGLRCEEWEALLADALDGLLPEHRRASFEAHGASCPSCSGMLTQATEGREWLGLLHDEPEVPPAIVGRILESTIGSAAIPVQLAAAPHATAGHAIAIPLRRGLHDIRLVMTFAMAFFSIALTLNLAGVRLNNLRMADLNPATLGSNLSRQFYGAKGQVVRYYDNLRFVYLMESKVRELRRDSETDQSPGSSGNKSGAKPDGSARKNGGRLEGPHRIPPRQAGWGQQLASLTVTTTVVTTLNRLEPWVAPRIADVDHQAERSLV